MFVCHVRRGAFDHFARQAAEQLSDLSDQEIGSTRKQLKTQQNMFALKLETSRQAAKVTMSNQKAETAAAAEREFTKKLTLISAGGDTALVEAQAQIVEMSEKVQELTFKANASDEIIKDSQKAVRIAEGAKASAEAQCATLTEGAQKVAQALHEVRSEYNASTEAPLHDQVKGLAQVVLDATAQCTETLQALNEIANESPGPRPTLTRRVQELITALKGSNVRASAQNEAAKAAAEAAKAEMQTALAEAKTALAEARTETGVAKTELEAARAEAAAARAEADAKGGGSVEDAAALKRLREEHDQLSAQIDELRPKLEETQEQLEHTQAQLNAEKQETERLQLECETLSSTLSISTAEAERAAAMREVECKKEVAEMATRMRLEVDEAERRAKERGSTPSQGRGVAEAAAERLRAENVALASAKEKVEAELLDAMDKLRTANAESALLRNELDDIKTAMESAGGASSVELLKVKKDLSQKTALLKEASEEVRRLEVEKAAAQEAMQTALQELNITVDKNRTLAEQVKDLVEASEAARKQVSDSKAALEQALTELNIVADKNRTLAEQVRALVGAAEEAKRQVDEAKNELRKALQDLGVTMGENTTLRQQVDELFQVAKSYREDADGELMVLREKLSATAEELSAKSADFERLDDHNRLCRQELDHREHMIQRLTYELEQAKQDKDRLVSEMVHAHAGVKARMGVDIERLEHEIAQCKRDNQSHRAELGQSTNMLSDALGSLGVLTTDKQGLSEQVNLLVVKYKSMRSTVRILTVELEKMLETITAALQAKDSFSAKLERMQGEVEGKLQRVHEGARQERTVLVNAALRSLDLLRGQLAAVSNENRLGTETMSNTTQLQQTLVSTMQGQRQATVSATFASAPPAEKRQWQPKATEAQGHPFKGKHRWGVAPEPLATQEIFEQASRAAPTRRAGRTLVASARAGAGPAPLSPRLPRTADTGTTPFAEALAMGEIAQAQARRRCETARLPALVHLGAAATQSVATAVATVPGTAAVAATAPLLRRQTGDPPMGWQ